MSSRNSLFSIPHPPINILEVCSIVANFLHKSWRDYLYWDTELEP